jgi:hypothetical protein
MAAKACLFDMTNDTFAGRFAITGLGLTEQGVRLGRVPRDLRREAFEAALADAGLVRRDIDGYIGTSSEIFDDIRYLGLAPHFAYTMQSGGATVIDTQRHWAAKSGVRFYQGAVQFDEQPAALHPAPGLREHTDEVLAELGYSWDATGIGEALARHCPWPDTEIISVSRRQHPDFETVPIDLTDMDSWDAVGEHLTERLSSFRGERALFIHNALYYWGRGYMGEGDHTIHVNEFLANCVAAIALGDHFLRAAVPAVDAGVDVGLVQMSSASARIAYPGYAIYGASNATRHPPRRARHRRSGTNRQHAVGRRVRQPDLECHSGGRQGQGRRALRRTCRSHDEVGRIDMDAAPSDESAKLAAWVEQRLRGRVIGITRIPRWRPAWNIDVEVGDRVIPLHARGEREPNIIMPYGSPTRSSPWNCWRHRGCRFRTRSAFATIRTPS